MNMDLYVMFSLNFWMKRKMNLFHVSRANSSRREQKQGHKTKFNFFKKY